MICDIEVSERASMVITTPGATRSHYMRSGIAEVEQKFRVKDDSFLEFNPGSLILQKSTSLEQNSFVDVRQDGEVLFVEKILPGRIAHGESFLFKKFSNRLRIQKMSNLCSLNRLFWNQKMNRLTHGKILFGHHFTDAFICFHQSCRMNCHVVKKFTI